MSMTQAMPLRMNALFPSASTNTSFNSTSLARAVVSVCQRGGTITTVKFHKRTTAGTGTVIGARIETVSDGYPTGTLVAAGASGTLTMDTSVGVQTITITTPPTVVAGDIVAVVLYVVTHVVSVAISPQIAVPYSLAVNGVSGLPGIRNNTAFTEGSASGWASGSGSVLPLFAGLFSDGEPLAGSTVAGSSTLTTTTVPTSGSDSYLGLKFTPDSDCNLEGVQWCGRADGSVKWELYDAANTLLGTSNVLPSGSLATTTANTTLAIFATPIALTGEQSYRLVERSVSGADNTQIGHLLADAVMLSAMFGDWVQTTSADGVNWTDNNTGLCPGILPFVTPITGGGGDYTYDQVKQLRYKMRQGIRA